MTVARLRLASVLVVVVGWSADLDVIFIISDVLCTAMTIDEQIVSFLKKTAISTRFIGKAQKGKNVQDEVPTFTNLNISQH